MDKLQLLNKYRDFIFEIQTNSDGFFIYFLKDVDIVPHDAEFNLDQVYICFESLSNDSRELLFEINLGVDVLAIFDRMVGHFKKTIRVESSEPDFEFSENSCIILKDIINDVIKNDKNNLKQESKDSLKFLEPYFFNNIRFL